MRSIWIVVASTMICVGCSVYILWLTLARARIYDIELKASFLAFSFLFATVSVFAHEWVRRRALQIQSILVDKSQDTIRNSRDVKLPRAVRLEMEEQEESLRYEIREISDYSDLPLFPGRYGPTAYFLINLIFAALAAWQAALIAGRM